MIALVREKQDALLWLCARYRVKRLELFGSATGEDFDPAHSDLDFMVEFLPLQPGEHAPAYFGLLAALEDLFQRPIDLVMIGAVQNPYFLEDIESTRKVLYAAA